MQNSKSDPELVTVIPRKIDEKGIKAGLLVTSYANIIHLLDETKSSVRFFSLTSDVG